MASRRRWTTLPSFDDRLTAELERAARPADPTGVLERVNRRRSRRAALRRVQAGLLAFAVLAATIGGFSILTRLFDPDRRVTLAVTPFGAEGAIVTCGDDTGGQICRIDAHALSRGATSQDLVRLTDFTGTLVSEPAVSADGTTVVFERRPPITGTSSLWTVRTDGARLRRLAPSEGGLADPSWSPEGTIVAVADEGGPDGTGPAELAIVDPDAATDPVIERIQLPGLTFPSAPSFSPDGTQILFVAGEDPNSAAADVYTIKTDGSNLTDLTRTPRSEWTAAWSPDGQRIAFGFASPSGEELFTCPLDCSNPRRLEDPSGVAIYGALPAWSPDGEWLAFEVVEENQDSAIHIARLDGGEVRTLASPASGFAWIPVHEVNSPEPSSRPEQAGQDIGMGFPVCQVSELAAQFDGEGATDTAFVATRLGDDMRCPSDVQRAEAYVGIDVDEDGLVDAAHGPIACEVYYCRAFAAPDLDGDDGKRELLVVESGGSVVGLGVYALAAEAGSPGNTEVVRIHIGEPDLVQTGFVTGEPARLFIGGDEGWSYRLRCEDHGVNRFVYQQRAFRPVDSIDPATVDETTLIYFQRRLNVFDAREPEQSTSDDPLGPQPEEVCGATIPKV
jgi:hypothetical protein